MTYEQSLSIGTMLFFVGCDYVWVKRKEDLWMCISTSRMGDMLSGVAVSRDLVVGASPDWVVM